MNPGSTLVEATRILSVRSTLQLKRGALKKTVTVVSRRVFILRRSIAIYVISRNLTRSATDAFGGPIGHLAIRLKARRYERAQHGSPPKPAIDAGVQLRMKIWSPVDYEVGSIHPLSLPLRLAIVAVVSLTLDTMKAQAAANPSVGYTSIP